MSDYGNIIDNVVGGSRTAATSGVVSSAEDNPDDAQRAFDLAQSSGIPADQIYGNLDAFERYYKGAMASQIVQNNPHLQDFANSHPLAPKLANDDWGNLDTVSKSVQQIGQKSVLSAAVEKYMNSSLDEMKDRYARRTAFNNAMLQGFAQGFGPGGPGSWLDKPKTMQQVEAEGGGALTQAGNALAWLGFGAATTIWAPEELGYRTFMGLLEAGTAGFKEALKQHGMSEQQAGSLAEETSSSLQMGLLHAGGAMGTPHVPAEFNALARQAAIEVPKVKPYLDAGVEPPRGVSTIVDQAKANQAKVDIDNLLDTLKESQSSSLRERNPDMFADFIRQHTQAEIGISSEAVRRLYGETIPAPDDGLLGFIPGIEDQLIGAEPTGGDLNVSLADWLAKVDPKVARELKDDIRVRRGGMTLAETKDLEPIETNQEEQPLSLFPQKEDEPLNAVDNVRRQGGFPTNQFMLQKISQGEGRFANVHDYDFVDEQGNRVGDIQLTYDEAKKDLYVEYVRHDQGPQAMGPRAMRNIMRQLQNEFPEAQTISGERVSGAREAVAKTQAKPGETPVLADWVEHVSVPLSRAGELLGELTDSRARVEGNQWVDRDGGRYVPTGGFTQNESKLVDAVDKVFQKISPRLVETHPVRKLEIEPGKKAYGSFSDYRNRIPLILWSLEGKDPVGTARHEIIHHLRRTGFLSQQEWRVLRDAAVKEKWIEKYNIKNRYKGESLANMIEESVAEHFASWHRDRSDPDSAVGKILQKISLLWEGIRSGVRGVFGKDVDWRDLFTKIESGEVGQRRDVTPLHPEAFRGPTYQRSEAQTLQQKGNQMLSRAGQRSKEPELPGITRVEDRAPFEEGALKGMTVRTQRKYMEFMRQRDQEDMEFARKQNEKDVARRQTEEWKANEKRIRDQVKPEFENRPDLAADKFLREGMLYGEKVRGKPRLNGSKLTPEQKAMLPKDYVADHGIHPYDAAGLLGYHTGGELVDALAAIHAGREASGLTPGRYVNHLVDSEVARRMQLEHGDLAQNILSEAQDHVISQTQFDMLHEETLAAAMQAEIDTSKSSPELPFTKEHMEQFARQRFSQLRMGQVSVEAHLRDGLKANELAERHLLSAEFSDAFKQKQRQAFAFLYAREAKKIEKARAQFEKTMKRFSAREVSGVAQEYTNFIHQTMIKIGYGVRRSVQDLNHFIQRSGYANLEEFWREKTDPASVDPREMPIADFLMNPNYKKQVDAMSVDEWKAVNDSIKTMVFNGRNERTILKAGEKADLEQTLQELSDQLGTFATKQATEGGLTSGGKRSPLRYVRTFTARLLQLEAIFNRIDRGDPRGLFNKLFSYPASEAANSFAALTRKYAQQYRQLKKFDVDLDEKIPESPFIEPLSRDAPNGETRIRMTRKGLRAVLQNVGNASNLDKLARGYGVEPDAIMSWLHQYAKKEDWDWAQAQGKIWDQIFEEASRMVESLSGLPPEKIPLTPIQTRFGTYEGWYHKIVYDPNRPGESRKLMGPNAEEQANFTRASTPRSWEKQRTGYAAPIDLSLDRNPQVMGQVLRDIAFRPFIHETSKIFYNPKFQMAMTRHFGDIYKDMLIPYLRDLGSTRNTNTRLGNAMNGLVEFTRQNIIASLIGMNPHTVYKHGLSALANSMGEVGVKDFAREVMSLYHADPVTGQTNWDFAMEKSEELQRRHQQWVDTLGGAHEEAIEQGGGKIAQARSMMIRAGAWPVSKADLLSAVPTFLAEYRKQIQEGATEGEAINLGNRAVRRAHGSTALSSRPEMMRGNALERLSTSLYGFFNQMLQRQYEIAWRAKEMIGDFKQGEYESGKAHIKPITSLIMTSIIIPAIVEEMVTGHQGDQKESWTERAAKGILGELSSSLPIVRDIVHAYINHDDPSIGLINTPWHEVKNLGVDLARPGMSMNRQHAGDLAKHFTTVFGMFTGLANSQIGKLLKFEIDTKTGAQHPQGLGDVYRGVTTGQSRERRK